MPSSPWNSPVSGFQPCGTFLSRMYGDPFTSGLLHILFPLPGMLLTSGPQPNTHTLTHLQSYMLTLTHSHTHILSLLNLANFDAFLGLSLDWISFRNLVVRPEIWVSSLPWDPIFHVTLNSVLSVPHKTITVWRQRLHVFWSCYKTGV